MVTFRSVFLLPLLLAPISFASPVPAPIVGPPPCDQHTSYSVSSSGQVDGAAFTAGISVPGGGTVSFGQSYSVSTTVTVGGGLTLNFGEIASLGGTGSYSITTGTATSETGSDTCPAGPWQCALKVTPSMWQVSGQATGFAGGPGCGAIPSGPYTVQYPIIDHSGNAVVNIGHCTCPDYPSANAPGAPPLCPSACKIA